MTSISPPASATPEDAKARRRGRWLQHITRWHWISSALSLSCLLFFALSGITLNNADVFENSTAQVTHHAGTLPANVLADMRAQKTPDLPISLRQWLRDNWQLAVYPKAVDNKPDEIFIDLKRPGVDAWISIDPHNGSIEFEADDHGWIAYFGDLHKGKNAGPVWSWFITLFGVVCVNCSLTGLLILWVHARARWSVWPITMLGLFIPLVLILLHIR